MLPHPLCHPLYLPCKWSHTLQISVLCKMQLSEVIFRQKHTCAVCHSILQCVTDTLFMHPASSCDGQVKTCLAFSISCPKAIEVGLSGVRFCPNKSFLMPLSRSLVGAWSCLGLGLDNHSPTDPNQSIASTHTWHGLAQGRESFRRTVGTRWNQGRPARSESLMCA